MIVLWTAVLIFLATLGFIGYSIYTSQYNVAWPPSVSDCPDNQGPRPVRPSDKQRHYNRRPGRR